MLIIIVVNGGARNTHITHIHSSHEIGAPLPKLCDSSIATIINTIYMDISFDHKDYTHTHTLICVARSTNKTHI